MRTHAKGIPGVSMRIPERSVEVLRAQTLSSSLKIGALDMALRVSDYYPSEPPNDSNLESFAFLRRGNVTNGQP
jgi:hypothetical protein